MYELAKSSREAMKSKARRLAGEKDSKVDSSNWSPAAPMNTEKKTGQPLTNKRIFNKGGKVDGAPCAFRADRKPRKAGGRVEKNLGGNMGLPAQAQGQAQGPAAGLARAAAASGRPNVGQQALAQFPRKSGGKVKKAAGGSLPSPQEAMESEARAKNIRVTDTKMPKPEEAAARSGKAPQDVPARKCGGRAKKNLGGVMEVLSPAYAAVRALQRGGKDEERDTAERAKGAMMNTALSAALNPPRKNGGKAEKRTARATGGRAKGKGKTNISINILAGGRAPAADMAAAMPPAPGAVPVPAPAPAPAPAAPPPAVMPIPMPMGGGQPPMGRKRGGRVYSSAKDMDAGAGTGEGRLEKTEIQQKKRRA